MGIYEDMASLANELMTDFTQSHPTSATDGNVVYLQVVPGNGPVDDPGTPTINRFALPAATVSGVSAYYLASSLAIAGDKLVTFPAASVSFVPDGTGIFEIDGLNYTISMLKKIPDTGTVIAYSIVASRIKVKNYNGKA